MILLGKNFGIALGLATAVTLLTVGCTKQAPPAAGAKDAPAQEGSQAPAAPHPAPQPVTLAEGTTLVVRTTTTLSTESHRTGDTFAASLEEPLMEGDRVIAPKGARVEGLVAKADKGGRVKGRAELVVRLTKLDTAAGGPLEISTRTLARVAKSTQREDAVKIGAGSGVGAVIGAIAGGGKGAAIGAVSGAGAGTGFVLATHGAPAVIPSESVLRFKLAAPVALKAPGAAPPRQ